MQGAGNPAKAATQFPGLPGRQIVGVKGSLAGISAVVGTIFEGSNNGIPSLEDLREVIEDPQASSPDCRRFVLGIRERGTDGSLGIAQVLLGSAFFDGKLDRREVIEVMACQAAASAFSPGNEELRVGIVLEDGTEQAIHKGNELHEEHGTRNLVAESHNGGTEVVRMHRASPVRILLVIKAQHGLLGRRWHVPPQGLEEGHDHVEEALQRVCPKVNGNTVKLLQGFCGSVLLTPFGIVNGAALAVRLLVDPAHKGTPAL
jgi:hypothetical protein